MCDVDVVIDAVKAKRGGKPALAAIDRISRLHVGAVRPGEGHGVVQRAVGGRQARRWVDTAAARVAGSAEGFVEGIHDGDAVVIRHAGVADGIAVARIVARGVGEEGVPPENLEPGGVGRHVRPGDLDAVLIQIVRRRDGACL